MDIWRERDGLVQCVCVGGGGGGERVCVCARAHERERERGFHEWHDQPVSFWLIKDSDRRCQDCCVDMRLAISSHPGFLSFNVLGLLRVLQSNNTLREQKGSSGLREASSSICVGYVVGI